ncbi:PAS domain S-box protein [bacterium]|nr:PAS domain S-box protein [candidate division CSSED10-310 bacterium]
MDRRSKASNRTKLLNRAITRLKNIESTLTQQTKLFPGTENRPTGIMFACDKSGLIAYISSDASVHFGFSPDQMTGHSYRDFVKEIDIPKADKAFKAVLCDKKPITNLVLGLSRKDGSLWWGEADLYAGFDDEMCDGVIGIIYNITEKVHQEQQLLHRNRLLNAINEFSIDLANMPDDRLFSYLGNRLLIKLNCMIAWIDRYDEQSGDLVIQHIATGETDSPIIRKILAFCKPGHRRPLPSDIYRKMIEEKYLITNCFQTIMFGSLPDETGSEITSALNIGWYLGVALVHHDKLLGTLIIAGTKDFPIPDRVDVLTFAGVTANAINRKNAREALIKSEERFRKLVKNSSDFLEILDRDGNELFVSGPVESITGYSVEEVIGSNAFRNIHPDDIETLRKALMDVIDHPEIPIRAEYRLRCKNGSWKYLEAVGSNLLDDPVINGIIVNVRDISDRKSTEAKLALAAELYGQVVEKASEMIVVTRGETIIYTNSNTVRILGYSLSELSHKPFSTFLHPDDRIEAMERYWRLTQGEDVPKSLMRVITREQAVRWTEVIGVAIEWDGQPAVLSFVTDITERYEMELALQASEERIKNYIRLAPIAITITDNTGKIIEANPAAYTMTGYEEPELVGKNLLELAVPESRPIVNSKLEEIKQIGRSQVCYQLKCRDGHLIWIDVLAVTLDEQTNIGFSRDITAQERKTKLIIAQKDLAVGISQSRNFNDTLNLCLNTAIQVSDMDCGGIYLVDPISKNLLMMVHSSLSSDFVQSVKVFSPGTFPYELVMQKSSLYLSNPKLDPLIKQSGLDIPLKSMAVLPIQCDGEIIGCLNVGSHTQEAISEESRIAIETIAGELGPTIARQSGTIKLRERERNLETFFKSTQDLIFVIGQDYKILELNPITTRLLGFSEQDLIQSTFLDLICNDQREQIHHMLSGSAEQPMIEISAPFITRNGELIDMETHITPGQWNGLPAFFAVSRDITERIRSDALRTKLERQLQQSQKLESLGIMAGGVAHDFNNILMAMLGYTELGLNKLPESSAVHQHLLQLQKNIHRASDLTRQMLAYAGKASFIMEPIDLPRLVMELSDLIKASISRQIKVIYEFSPDLPPIKGDPNQIQHVVMNLLINASEAIGDQSGVIRIAASMITLNDDGDSLHLWPTIISPGNYLLMTIADTGCGMNSETLSRVFEPFFTTKFTGRGLGLASVQGIVLGHKGTIRVSSTLGKGTVFEMLLPVAEFYNKETNNLQEQTIRSWHGDGTVLLAEDEDDLRDIGSEMLETMGLRVYPAKDGQEAIDIFIGNHSEIDLVLLDLTMPVKSGAEVLQLIRQKQPKCKVVLTSGFSKEDVIVRFKDRDINGFLSKPYSFEELKKTVFDAIAKPLDENENH